MEHHHHHHHRVVRPSLSIAVSTSWRHFERSCARIHAVLRPMLWSRRSSSIVRSHVRLGRPAWRRQSAGGRLIHGTYQILLLLNQFWWGNVRKLQHSRFCDIIVYTSCDVVMRLSWKCLAVSLCVWHIVLVLVLRAAALVLVSYGSVLLTSL